MVSFTRFTGRLKRMPTGTLLHWRRSVPVVVVMNGLGAPNWFEASSATRVAVGQNVDVVGAPNSVTPRSANSSPTSSWSRWPLIGVGVSKRIVVIGDGAVVVGVGGTEVLAIV